MAGYYTILVLHLIGAAIWVGGHLVLAAAILPRAWRDRRAAPVQDFEQRFEVVGLSALGVQIATGLWLAHHLLGSPANWFAGNPVARAVQLKLALLLATLLLALSARRRVLPRLTDETLPRLGWHILGVSVAAVGFVVAGAMIRFGGYPLFRR